MTARQFLDRLHGVRPSGRHQWQARCPSHDDDHASLRIGEGDDGRILVHCHAGCTAEDVVAALRLKMRDLFPKCRGGKIVAEYSYTDERGVLLYQVVRFEPKAFRLRRPNADGSWTWKVGGTRRVLYRLPEVLEAARTVATVFVCEGEADADRLAALGLTATTSPMGADGWRHAYAEKLAGAEVVVLPDRDDAGHRYALRVAASCCGRATSVRIVHLPGVPEHGDVSDWLDAGGTVEELEQLVEATPKWSPGGPASDDEHEIVRLRRAIGAAPIRRSETSTRLVLMTLLTYPRPAFPSEKTIAECTGLSERTVRRCIGYAKEAGVLVVAPYGRGQAWRRNVYHIVAEAAATQVSAPSSPKVRPIRAEGADTWVADEKVDREKKVRGRGKGNGEDGNEPAPVSAVRRAGRSHPVEELGP